MSGRRILGQRAPVTLRAARIVLGAAIALTACDGRGRGGSAPPPNVLLVTLDTTRADHCSVDGYERDTTPRLRAVAAEGTRFATVYAPMPATSPSHATLFTGAYPATHGVLKNGIPLDGKLPTLAETLAANGYQTAAVVSSFALAAKWGLSRGFSTWDDDFPLEGATVRTTEWEGFPIAAGFDRRADATTDRALTWLERTRRPGQPFFLFVHYFDPHDPYVPPPGWGRRFGSEDSAATPLARTISLYDAEIAFMDSEVGRLLDGLARLGLADGTLVVIAGDHGEGLAQHGYMHHGMQIYEESVRVPWLWRWPGQIQPGRVLDAPVQLVDFFPTVLELAGVARDGFESPGLSLAGALRGEAELPRNRPVHLQRRWQLRSHLPDGQLLAGEQFGVREGDWKLIQASDEGRLELYDLAADPRETHNLARSDPGRVRALGQRIESWLRKYRRAPEGSMPAISEDDRRRLEALGYVQ